MKKILVLLLPLIVLLNSCNNDSPTNNPPPPPAPPAQNSNLSLITHRYLVQDQQLLNQYRSRANKAVDVYKYSSDEIVELARQGQLRGDVVIVEDLYDAHQLKKAGVISPYNAGTFGDYIPSR